MFVGRTQIYTHTHTHTYCTQTYKAVFVAGKHAQLCQLWAGGKANPIRLQSRLLNKLRHRPSPDLARCPYSPFSILSSPFSPPPFLRYALAEPTSRRFSPLHLLAKPLHVLRLLISVLFPFFCSFCCFRQHFGPN